MGIVHQALQKLRGWASGAWRVVRRRQAVGPTLAQFEEAEERLLQLPQAEVPLRHRFAPGLYMREVTMGAGTLVLGHEHKTEHFNIVLTGRASVLMDGQVREVVAPCVLRSKAGCRKLLYIHETMRWLTVHPTQETNVAKLEELLVVKSGTWRRNEVRLLEERVGRPLMADGRWQMANGGERKGENKEKGEQ